MNPKIVIQIQHHIVGSLLHIDDVQTAKQNQILIFM